MQHLFRHLTLLIGLLVLAALPGTITRGQHLLDSLKEYRELKKKQEKLRDASDVMIRQQEVLAGLDARTHPPPFPHALALAAYLDSSCQRAGVRLLVFPQASATPTQEYELTQIQFALQGSFQGLLRLLHQVEREQLGNLSSLRLEKQVLRKSGMQEEVLRAEVELTRIALPNP